MGVFDSLGGFLDDLGGFAGQVGGIAKNVSGVVDQVRQFKNLDSATYKIALPGQWDDLGAPSSLNTPPASEGISSNVVLVIAGLALLLLLARKG